MGIVSFFKEAGEKLFGSKDTEAAAAGPLRRRARPTCRSARAANDAAARRSRNTSPPRASRPTARPSSSTARAAR